MPKSKFKCPQCLSDVVVSPELAGTKTQCPVCDATLTVPLSLGHDSLFDDLFDEDDGSDDDSNDEQDNQGATWGSAEPTVDESQAETKPSTPLEAVPPSRAKVAAEASVPELVASDVVSDFVSDAGVDGGDDADGDEEAEAATDPFAYNEDKAIHIDGVSDGLLAPGSFYFKCPVCDSHMKGNESQAGEKIRCTDCFSEIPVIKPEKSDKEDVWRRAATIKVNDDEEEELKLADPVARPKVDYTISPGHGLAEIENDLLSPVVEPELVETVAPKIVKPRRSKTRAPADARQRKSQPDARPQTSARDNSNESGKRRKPIQLADVGKFDFLGDLDFMLRTSVTVVFLTLFYTMEESVFRTLGMEDLNGGQKAVRYLPALVGSFVCFALFGWFMAVTFSVLMQNVANGMKRVEEWVGFAPSEWLGSFLIFAISAWAALLPGSLVGYLMMKVTCLLYTSPSPRDQRGSRMPSSA